MPKIETTMSGNEFSVRATVSDGQDKTYLGYNDKGFQIQVTAKDADVIDLIAILNKVVQIVESMIEVQTLSAEAKQELQTF